MRITGGRATGRLLISPKGSNIRPTSDRVRSAIFNLIGQDLTGLRVLDLFAGTGSLGLDSLSRGAVWVLFVDRSPKSIHLIKRNLALCGYENRAGLLRWNLRKGMPRDHPMVKGCFDLAFLDPPYGQNLIPSSLTRLTAMDVLSSGSYVIAETAKAERAPCLVGELRRVDTRLYGDTRISIYRHEVKK